MFIFLLNVIWLKWNKTKRKRRRFLRLRDRWRVWIQIVGLILDQRSMAYSKSKVSRIESPKRRSSTAYRRSGPPLVWREGEMAEDKEATTSSLSQGLAPQDPEDPPKSPPNSPNSSTRKVHLSTWNFVIVKVIKELEVKLIIIIWLYDLEKLYELHFWTGLLCCSSELGVQEVYDWLVNHSLLLLTTILYIYFFLSRIKSNYTVIWVFLFMLCSVVLFPVAVTFLITWWFIQFVDGFFSPIYESLGVDIFGKAEITLLLLYSLNRIRS